MKQEFTKHINERNKTNKYWKSQGFYAKLLKIDKKSYKNIDIYYIGYSIIRKIDDYGSVYTVNPLYLNIDHASGYIEETNGNKYLIFASADKKKKY